MKPDLRFVLLLAATLTTSAAAAQTGSVGIGVAVPASTSLLELSSTSKGFLPPRMTQAQRNAIASPADGLIVYQTDNTPGLYQRLTTGWATLGTLNTESKTDIVAPTTAASLAPGTTTVVYTTNSNGSANGTVTLGAGQEGQRLVIINNDEQYLPVVSASGTGNLLPRYGARYIYTAGAWRRES
ncbi:hypothetical protein [Hymenobacter canadensis]|uniref:Uncharacterized protein n=1 Tax=Hymenobacter canadensis TaxID=2999067 RepID=A0ABY7LL06_9BACT|nr:hypothetical protein [Hymenobacter canadensis]WBA41135.1 hypothetical protein O3303_15080 [Hymenobacter canadensis]